MTLVSIKAQSNLITLTQYEIPHQIAINVFTIESFILLIISNIVLYIKKC